MRPERNILLVAAVAFFTACGDDDFTQVRVMTQNLAVGIELEPILLAQDPGDIPGLVQIAWGQKDTSDFELRVGRIADAIQASDADLVGLQEVIQFFEGPADGPVTQASTPVKDFLELLLAELATRGLAYVVVDDGTDEGIVSNADIELTGTAGMDYRVVDREAVIAKSSVQIVDVQRGNYAAHLSLVIGGVVPFDYLRGWVMVDAVKDGKAFTFVSTHVEPFHAGVQSAQASELLALLDTASPTLLVGDLNSEPNDPVWAAYGMLVSPTTGISDAAAEVGAGGFTSGRDALCADFEDKLEKRIDFVLHSPHFQAASVELFGESDADYVDGLWPSDHAGVAAVLEIE